MDITYRPYIREDSFNTDYSLSRPVPVSEYTPKYLVTKEATDTPEENSVESSIDLSIQETPIEEYQSLVKKPIKKFTSKEEFKSIMTPIYERLLRQKGLNPTFAKALVAQDGLESAWGKKPSGLFNFGGIKGKGTVASTREVINGKDIRLNQEFKDFSSLEDYANYKINLLNNKRYRAFSGSVNDFASRVARGGYATDPKYQSVLHKMIQNSKLGGILKKLQEGGRIKDRWTDREDIESTQEWMTNWYNKRRHIINKNLWERSSLPKWLQSKTLGYHWLNDRLTSVDTYLYNSGPEEQEEYKQVVNGPLGKLLRYDISDKLMENKEGFYNPKDHYLVVKANSKVPVSEIAAHELAHSTNPYFIIDTIKEYEKRRPIHTIHVSQDDYLDNPAEIYSRLMQFRRHHNIDPTHVFTEKEIEEFRDKQTQKIQYGYTFKNNNTGKRVAKVVDKIDYSMYPGSTKDWHLEDATMFRHYKSDGDPDLFNRYNDDFLLFLLNDVAKAPTKKNDKVKSTKFGGIIPKFQNSGKFYTIKQGDTLLNIAKKNNLQLPQILKLNPSIQDPNKIQVGQHITLVPSTNQLYEQTNDLIHDNLSKRKGPMFFQTDLEKDHKLNFIPKDSQFKDLKEQVENMVHHPQYQNIVNILSKAGLKDYVVHGIIGNMWQESKFDPNGKSSNGTYNGLVQLSPRLWNNYQLYLQKNNLTNTIENQLQYLIPIWTNQTNSNPHDIEGVDIFKDEWGGGGRQDEFWSEISKTNSASKAAMLFRHYFERPQSSDTYRRELLADWSYRYINGE